MTGPASTPAAVDLVVAHGTGTALNDPAEARRCARVLARRRRSAGDRGQGVDRSHLGRRAALVNLDVALRCLAGGVVPPITGLRTVRPTRPRDCGFADGRCRCAGGLVQVNAFGFGGVNAVTLLVAAV